MLLRSHSWVASVLHVLVARHLLLRHVRLSRVDSGAVPPALLEG